MLDASVLSGKKPGPKKVKVVVVTKKTVRQTAKGPHGWGKQAKAHGRMTNRREIEGRKQSHDHPPKPHEQRVY